MENSWWPETYFDSRRSFIDQASVCGASLSSFDSEMLGPDGETLSTDVAAFISQNDRHRIFLLSGVHGVEGFVGASVQMQVMKTLLYKTLPAGIGVVLIHGVNPWGFAHLRRVDENNVDVNRNFLDGIVSMPSSHRRYPALDPVINPAYPPSLLGELRYWLQTARLVAMNKGIKRLAGPIAQGQCDFPKGLFYGGMKSGLSSLLLQRLLLQYTDNIVRATILDVHSGLGPSGKATLISNTNCVDAERRLEWLQNQYQQAIVLDDNRDNAYSAQGSLSQWCAHSMSDKQFLYLCVEIGTVNPMTLFSALRRENQAHHWSDHRDKIYRESKKRLLEVFAPSASGWRQQAISEGLRAFEAAVASVEQ